MRCSKCGNEFEGKFCPECGAAVTASSESTTSNPPALAPKKKSGCLKIGLIVLLIFVVLGVIGSAIGGDETPIENTSSNPVTSVAPESESVTKEDSDQSVPAEYKAALKKAKSYAKMNMSKASIYNQLTSEYGEQFPAEAAQYAVDNLVTDYKANALAKAKSYRENMSMSNEAIRDQLTSEYGEQFTQEEADYAIENLPD